jgi:GT2 family glycosyltransferase
VGTDEDLVAPPVVVVMVAHDPGAWWTDALSSLAMQTYANLSVLVIDTASERDLTAELARVLPSAHLRRLDHDPGYSEAANEALGSVEGAAFLLLCHDDVVFDPSAVQSMVEEAFRSNAGVVGPKIVEWDDPRRLVQVGLGADKFGAPSPLVDRGELDQEQHDAVRDVFTLPGGALLVRADLFETLRGFDPGIDFLGEDLDFCWRAHVAGARVLVAPTATIAHRMALDERRDTADRRRLVLRHRLRTVLTCYGRGHRLRVVPQAAVLAVLEAIYAVLFGRLRHAADVVAAWWWNLRRLGEVRARRRQLREIRRVPDREIRRMQVRGSAQIAGAFRGQRGSGDDRLTSMAGAGRELAQTMRSGNARVSLVAWAFVAVVLIVGSRDLLTGTIPAIGELAEFADAPGQLLSQWVSGYHQAGLGSGQANPTAYGALGLAGYLFFGAMGTLRKVLILGMLPLGVLGMWRLGRPIGSRRSRSVGLVLYAVVPVATGALAVGNWGGLVLYGLAPWIVNQLARASRLAPYGIVGGDAGPGTTERSVVQRIFILGVLTAIGALVVPATVPVVVGAAVAMALGGLVVGQVRGILRLLVVTVGAVALAVVLQLPWSLEFATTSWAELFGLRVAGQPAADLGAILRFTPMDPSSSVLGWAVLVTAALALLIGRQWRLGWAMRGWALALAAWGVLWAASQGYLDGYLPNPEILLAPAGVGIALAGAMGMAAFEVDLPDYHFGWRQIASLVAGAALMVAIVPFLQRSFDGAWGMPRGDFNQTLSRLPSPNDSFRMLWIGEPDVMPVPGWDLPAGDVTGRPDTSGLVFATTAGRTPSVTDLWPGSSVGATEQLPEALAAAAEGQTTRLGSLLAPMGVEYVVVPRRQAPFPYVTEDRSNPELLLDVLGGQLDLARVELVSGIDVYRNTAWGPALAQLPIDADIPAGGGEFVTDRTITDLAGAPAALTDTSGYASASGSTNDPATIFLSSGATDRWQLTRDGQPVAREDALGWANQYRVDAGGALDLTYATPSLRFGWLALQALLWVLCLWYVWHSRVAKEDARDRARLRTGVDL